MYLRSFILICAVLQCIATIRQVAYISTTTDPHGFSDSDIRDILFKCRQFNTDNDITGVLLSRDTTNFQIIEGESKAITEVLGRIFGDERHRGIIILYDTEVNERCFARWAMMYRDLHHTDLLEEWGEQTEISLFNDITQIGGLNSSQSTEIASRKAHKLLMVYRRLLRL